ncbi:glycosyltransferase family 2 protein [Marinobacterium sp. YM272]|uniref:glycosyltransferase family 2 protein n=1 Tax=Marinobacterium sp. YM272 TaxID=3421654 RepID=UPI003D7FCC01
MLLNLCVCTYGRLKLLQRCIESLLSQTIPDNVTFCITVIDNDLNRSAESVVRSLDRTTDKKINYSVEERRGIPCARNKALDVSKEIGADLLIFIDDDEIAGKGWLAALYEVSKKYNHQAAVHGLVIPQLVDDIPESIAGLFRVKKRPEGKALTACATDNVSIPMQFVTEQGLRFDESRPLAGGTDTIFFTEAHAQGLSIYQTNTAVVYEEVPPGRCSLKWLVKRKFRSGMTGAWRKRQHGRSGWSVMSSALIQAAAYMLMAVIYFFIFKGLKRNECILKSARSAGVFVGCFKKSIDSY